MTLLHPRDFACFGMLGEMACQHLVKDLLDHVQ